MPVLQRNFGDGYAQVSSTSEHAELAIISRPWRDAAGNMTICYHGDNARVKPTGAFTLGVYIGPTHIVPAGRCEVVVLPYWLMVVTGAILPGLVLGRRKLLVARTNFRVRSSLCAGCGYDLRSSPGRCPECGAAPIATA